MTSSNEKVKRNKIIFIGILLIFIIHTTLSQSNPEDFFSTGFYEKDDVNQYQSSKLTPHLHCTDYTGQIPEYKEFNITVLLSTYQFSDTPGEMVVQVAFLAENAIFNDFRDLLYTFYRDTQDNLTISGNYSFNANPQNFSTQFFRENNIYSSSNYNPIEWDIRPILFISTQNDDSATFFLELSFQLNQTTTFAMNMTQDVEFSIINPTLDLMKFWKFNEIISILFIINIGFFVVKWALIRAENQKKFQLKSLIKERIEDMKDDMEEKIDNLLLAQKNSRITPRMKRIIMIFFIYVSILQLIPFLFTFDFFARYLESAKPFLTGFLVLSCLLGYWFLISKSELNFKKLAFVLLLFIGLTFVFSGPSLFDTSDFYRTLQIILVFPLMVLAPFHVVFEGIEQFDIVIEFKEKINPKKKLLQIIKAIGYITLVIIYTALILVPWMILFLLMFNVGSYSFIRMSIPFVKTLYNNALRFGSLYNIFLFMSALGSLLNHQSNLYSERRSSKTLHFYSIFGLFMLISVVMLAFLVENPGIEFLGSVIRTSTVEDLYLNNKIFGLSASDYNIYFDHLLPSQFINTFVEAMPTFGLLFIIIYFIILTIGIDKIRSSKPENW